MTFHEPTVCAKRKGKQAS